MKNIITPINLLILLILIIFMCVIGIILSLTILPHDALFFTSIVVMWVVLQFGVSFIDGVEKFVNKVQ